MSRRLHVGIFEDEAAFLRAAEACRSADLEIVDAFSPYPLHRISELLGLKRSRLPWVTLAGGLAGALLGLWFQRWASSVSWPIDVGGKPWDSLPAFVPVAFELTVLFAGIGTVVALLVRSGLRPLARPRVIAGVTDSRFALVVGQRREATRWTPIADTLRRHGAIEHWEEVS